MGLCERGWGCGRVDGVVGELMGLWERGRGYGRVDGVVGEVRAVKVCLSSLKWLGLVYLLTIFTYAFDNQC